MGYSGEDYSYNSSHSNELPLVPPAPRAAPASPPILQGGPPPLGGLGVPQCPPGHQGTGPRRTTPWPLPAQPQCSCRLRHPGNTAGIWRGGGCVPQPPTTQPHASCGWPQWGGRGSATSPFPLRHPGLPSPLGSCNRTNTKRFAPRRGGGVVQVGVRVRFTTWIKPNIPPPPTVEPIHYKPLEGLLYPAPPLVIVSPDVRVGGCDFRGGWGPKSNPTRANALGGIALGSTHRSPGRSAHQSGS